MLLKSVWFKISIKTLKSIRDDLFTKELKGLWCFYAGQESLKNSYAKELVQFFVSEMLYFTSHMFSALVVLKGGIVFDSKATRAQTIVLPGGKGGVFISFVLRVSI